MNCSEAPGVVALDYALNWLYSALIYIASELHFSTSANVTWLFSPCVFACKIIRGTVSCSIYVVVFMDLS